MDYTYFAFNTLIVVLFLVIYIFICEKRSYKYFKRASESLDRYIDDEKVKDESKLAAYSLYKSFSSFKTVVLMPFISIGVFYCVFISKSEPKEIRKEDRTEEYKLFGENLISYYWTRWPIENSISILLSLGIFLTLAFLYLVCLMLLCIVRTGLISSLIHRNYRVKFLNLARYNFML